VQDLWNALDVDDSSLRYALILSQLLRGS